MIQPAIFVGVPDQPHDPKKPHNGHAEDEARSHRLPTILVIDDSPQDHALVQAAADEMGLEVAVRFAHHAEQARAYFEGRAPFEDRKTNPPPDLVLLDLQMPGEDGFEVLKWLRGSSSPWKRVPVVILSTSSAREEMALAYDLGANSYLVKPTTFDGLCSLIGETARYWLDRNRRA